MNRTLSYVLLIVTAAILLIVSLVRPYFLSDANAFLKGFVSHELLGFLGVIVTITLASAAQLHLSFNRIEERYSKKDGLSATRKTVKDGSYWMIWLLLAGVFLVIVKSHIPSDPTIQSLVNSAAIWIVFFNVLILADLTQLVFQIGPDIEEDE